jgi:hypothetical protein
MIAPRDWLALAARTETTRPHEYPAIMAVILNRMRAGKTWPDSVVRVVRQPNQFSGFNAFRALVDDACYAAVRGSWVRNIGEERVAEILKVAAACADDMLSRPAHLWPLDPATYWYWSPQSMEPVGRVPEWASDLYSFSLSGIHPWRFTFAMAVARTDPYKGNAFRQPKH